MKSGVLLGPWLDPLALGGLSIAVYLLAFTAPGRFLQALPPRPDILLCLNAAFSYPHIMAAYALFYGAEGNWREHRAISLAIPAALAAALIAAVASESPRLLILMAQVSLPLLYWHFFMQSFGCALWLHGPSETGERARLGRTLFKNSVLLSSALLGIAGFVSLHAAHATGDVFTLAVEPIRFPAWAIDAVYHLGLASFATLGAGFLAEAALAGGRPASLLAVVPIAATYFWFDPRFALSPLRLLLPVFHGLQYLAFCARAELRIGTWPRVIAAWAALGLAGMLAFQWVPRGLGVLAPASLFSAPQRILAAFAIFLNFHHYFIDTVLWKMSDPRVRARLGLIRGP